MERITPSTVAKTDTSRGSTWNMMIVIASETPQARAIPMARPIAICAAPCLRSNFGVSHVGGHAHGWARREERQHDPEAAGTQSDPDVRLLGPECGPRQEKIRDVGARHEQ